MRADTLQHMKIPFTNKEVVFHRGALRPEGDNDRPRTTWERLRPMEFRPRGTQQNADTATTSDTAQKDWTDKLHQTQFILRKLDTRSEIVIGCSFDGDPIGLAALRTPDADAMNANKGLELVNMVTHPGGTGAGGALIERAADVSSARGFEGRLQVVPMGTAATAAYAALGFVWDGELMTLTGERVEIAFQPGNAFTRAARCALRDGVVRPSDPSGAAGWARDRQILGQHVLRQHAAWDPKDAGRMPYENPSHQKLRTRFSSRRIARAD
jgi:hypothetical protein